MFKAISEDDLAKFKHYLEAHKWTPNSTEPRSLIAECTVFARCVKMGAKRCFEWCLHNGADVNLTPLHGKPALAYAFKDMYFFRALIRIPTLDIATNTIHRAMPRHLDDTTARMILDGVLNHPNYYPDDDDATDFLGAILTANRRVAFEYLGREYRYDACQLAKQAIVIHDENAFTFLLSRVSPNDMVDLKHHAIGEGNAWAFRTLMRVDSHCDDGLFSLALDKLYYCMRYHHARLEILDYMMTIGLPRGCYTLSWANLIDNAYAWDVLVLLASHGRYIPDDVLHTCTGDVTSRVAHYRHNRDKLELLLRYISCYRPSFDITARGLLEKIIAELSGWEHDSTRHRLGDRRYATARQHDPEMVKLHGLLCEVVQRHYQSLESVDKKQALICLVHKTIRTHPVIGLDAVLEPYIGTL